MPTPGLQVDSKEAQKAHSFLLGHGLMDKSYKPLRAKQTVVFPIKKILQKDMQRLKKVAPSAKQVKKKLNVRSDRPHNLKDALAGKLTRKEFRVLPSSFDLLGDVAIIEVPQGLEGKEKQIAKALMQVNKSVISVYKKTGAHSGVFRSEPVEFVAGIKKEFATYKEHGCTYCISIGKVFFSPRLSTERKRISGQIKKGEVVAALFAGVGPFPICFAKNSKMEKAIAIELNPVAVEDLVQNIRVNKVEDKVVPILGDVNEFASKYSGTCDRAVMPLPKGGEDFLEGAIRYIKPSGGVVHYYQFVPRENPFEVPHTQIAAACKKLGRKFEVLFERKVREYAPDIIQVVVDFRVWEE